MIDKAVIRKSAFAMPFHSPSYPPGPYRFEDREYMIITYRTDREALERIVPEPLEVVDSIVKYEFIRMPDSTGFGAYAGAAQVIPVRFDGAMGGYTHAMFLDTHPPIAGGGSFGAFPKRSRPGPANAAGPAQAPLNTTAFGIHHRQAFFAPNRSFVGRTNTNRPSTMLQITKLGATITEGSLGGRP